MSPDMLAAAVGLPLAIVVVVAIVLVLSGASLDERLRAAEAPPVDIDEPIPYLPVDVPPTVEDVAWLRAIGVQP